MTEPAKGGPSSVRALCSPRNLTQPHATVLSSWPGPCHQSTRPTTPTRRLRLVHQLGHLRSITNSPILHPSGWKLPVISVGKWDGSFWPQGNGTLGSGRQACESAWCGASGSSARANVASREASESSARPALVAVAANWAIRVPCQTQQMQRYPTRKSRPVVGAPGSYRRVHNGRCNS